MESQPQNPEFRNNPENFHPCSCDAFLSLKFIKKLWGFFYIQGHTFIFYLMILLLIMSMIVIKLWHSKVCS